MRKEKISVTELCCWIKQSLKIEWRKKSQKKRGKNIIFDETLPVDGDERCGIKI